jgi:FkbM family methyltransferase
MASSLKKQHLITVVSNDNRKFLLNPRELQFHIGLLGLGEIEPISSRMVRNFVSQGNTALDVGANYGWFSTLLSKQVGSSGSVHSFEPVPKTFQILKRNCSANSCNNIQLNQSGLSSEKTKTKIHVFHGQPCGNASIYNEDNSKSDEFEISLQSLDEYVREQKIKKVNFIKCDAEGCEQKIIEGGRNTLASQTPVILMEVNESSRSKSMYGYEPKDLLQDLAKIASYRFYLIREHHEISEIASIKDFHCGDFDANVLCVPNKPELIEKVHH